VTVKWLFNEESNTLGHVSELTLEGKTVRSPQHALSPNEIEAIAETGLKAINDNIVICGESLDYSTFQGIGKQATVSDSLINRFKNKTVSGKINLVYIRIPSEYNLKGSSYPVKGVDDLQASAIVGAQLEADASAIIPPIPNGIENYKIFKRILDRTKIENQTFRKQKEIIGLIPKTNEIQLIPQMIKDYTKLGVRVFAMDFSGSYLPQSMIRTTIISILDSLKIKNPKVPEEKQYYIHVFNAATCVRTNAQITSMTDILTHAYGIDSTSGMMWGGGRLEHDKLRYFNMQDYGAYSIGSMSDYSIKPSFIIPNAATTAYRLLRAHRIMDYYNECKAGITSSIASGDPKKGYATYLNSKTKATDQVNKILSDIKEIKARLW
jgi:hypothetical protein